MLAYIKELLKQNNLQQKEFASMIGVSPAAISQWEGIDKIRPEVLYKISRLFSISIDDLLEEKFKDEPIAKKCRRLYNLGGYEVDIMLKRKEVDALLEYSTRLKNIHERMWELLYLKALKKISREAAEELNYLKPYLQIDVDKHPLLNQNEKLKSSTIEDEDIAEAVSAFTDINDKKGFIWELKKVYSIKNRLEWSDVYRLFCFEEDKWGWLYDKEVVGEKERAILTNVILSYPEIERDVMLSNFSQPWSYFTHLDGGVFGEILLSQGAKVLFMPLRRLCGYKKSILKPLYKLNITKEEFERLEGEKKPLYEMSEAMRVLKKVVSEKAQWGGVKKEAYYPLSYEEYQKVIDHRATRMCSYSLYKYTNPSKYLDDITREGILVL